MGRRYAVLLIITLLSLSTISPLGGSDEGGPARGPGPFEDEKTVWSDTLDDLGHVYQMVGVEVSGGDAHLASGETTGWLATSIIAPPDGCRYDLVLLEVETPGASYLELSVLDASEEPSEVGFANETIPGFKLVRVEPSDAIISTLGIGRKDYPEVRIQVTFNANGSASPRLLSWSLHFVGIDEWCDEFLSPGKMSEHGRLNFTDDALEIDLSFGRTGGEASYEPYPTLAVRALYGVATLHYPNAANDGYMNAVSLTGSNGDFFHFDDIDGDGIQDLIYSGQNQHRYHLADASGTYSATSFVDLTTAPMGDVTSGDFNNDGWSDLIFKDKVFMNEGDGTIDDNVDITLSRIGFYLTICNINGDDFDDIATIGYFQGNYHLWVYLGNNGGLNTTADIDLDFGTDYHIVATIKDLDGDGYDDLIVILRSGELQKYKIYMGDGREFKSTPSYTLSVNFTEYFYDMYGSAGDLNGDGFYEIVAFAMNRSQVVTDILIYEGASNGWNSTRYQVFQLDERIINEVLVLDIDIDGYDDIVTTVGDNLVIAYGGTEFPTQWNITKYGGGSRLAAAVGRGTGEVRTYRGGFTTEPITLPPGKSWDLLSIEGTFPEETFISIDLLDPSGEAIDGFEGLSDPCVDLSDLGTAHSTIKVRVVIHSNQSTATPTLESIRVNWMDPRTWRDGFYGHFKIDKLLNLDVMDGYLQPSKTAGPGPQLVLTSVRGDEGYNTNPQVFLDAGGGDYLSREPVGFKTQGTSAADVGDVDGDGNTDIVFAVHSTNLGFSTSSPLYRGTPTGFLTEPLHTFQTKGASDVLIRDIDCDGFMDVVFAQEYDGLSYGIDSVLFWGSASGWNDTHDVEFSTKGASDVDVVDIDGDGMLDLVFACYRDDSGTSMDSMVFLQNATGFCGTEPSHRLTTKGARAVASGDLDEDGRLDLVFANSLSGGIPEIDSYIYWGKGNGFEDAYDKLPTAGAMDVEVADMDGDGDLDIVFANHIDNSLSYHVDSEVYLNDGSGGFPSSADIGLPTVGASAVAVADLDGTGWKDLVFACEFNGTNYSVPSRVFLGGASGWSSTPDILLPTEGASDVLAAHLIDPGHGGYMSEAITPEDPVNTGAFHTLRYACHLGPSESGRIQIVDATTLEVLTETALQEGSNEWLLEGCFSVKEHGSIRVMAYVLGMDHGSGFWLDDLWLNWTERVKQPPRVLDLDVMDGVVLRSQGTTIVVNVTDEYDLPEELVLTVHHRLNGTVGWSSGLVGKPTHLSGATFHVELLTKMDTPVGKYDLQVRVSDCDGMYSPYVEFPSVLDVRNNVPTAPEVRIEPEGPRATSTLMVAIARSATDVEGSVLTYRYLWYLDGALVEGQTTDSIPASLLRKGQNWSVEVRAFDGDDEGPPALAWVVILNTPPVPKVDLPDPELKEDSVDTEWLDLSDAFEDADGDQLTWSLKDIPEHIGVAIDPETGMVTLAPEADWFGDVDLTFVASDGEASTSQTVTVHVTSVNDAPVIASVNEEPVMGGTIELTVRQDELLTIDVLVVDVEGDELVLSVNTSRVTLDAETGRITFQPGNDDVGVLRFRLTVNDLVSPGEKVTLDFLITVENANDPMEDPRISAPRDGDTFEVNETFTLVGFCDDPDCQHGQVLSFSWESNISGLLGHGSSLTLNISESGTHLITLTVTDGEFTRTATVQVVIEALPPPPPPPPPPPGEEDEGINVMLVLGLVVVLVIVGALLFVVTTRRRTEQLEAEDEAYDKQVQVEHMRKAVKEAADLIEQERVEAAAEAPSPEEIQVETEAVPSTGVTMEAREAEAASAQTLALFERSRAAEPVMTEEEREELRLESLKRKYQNAIGRLPYGIPSKELADRDWVDLAAALATGEKRQTPGGRELTMIDGTWYYSEVKDTGTFLKEYGAKPKKEEPKRKKEAVVTMDRAALLAKLEERFILGEISEETYSRLVERYSEED